MDLSNIQTISALRLSTRIFQGLILRGSPSLCGCWRIERKILTTTWDLATTCLRKAWHAANQRSKNPHGNNKIFLGPWKAPKGTNDKVTSAKGHLCAYPSPGEGRH